ncbi:diaminopimelate decarboxylase family protein [Winogradskya humida]|uniref:Diaminopimelate decarboxylase n=1 Tax=Winogradskya humida TaxID=113566 RepID=A0ABQ3ZXE8_9ACTN|nr:diaminopimelate decarboxylase [Actinoplanes humidus]GIE23223.1 diaminopimelate decarboxylase [Actinoplanes humidus]
MPISDGFARRLEPVLPAVAEHFGTPFHIYDLQGLHETATGFKAAFAGMDVREYFAVKGQPNPAMLRRVREYGFGFDCSSPAELWAATEAGASGEDICFTSNNTSYDELAEALRLGAIITADDETVVDKLIAMGARPRSLALRVHPGTAGAVGESYLGDAESAKFGVRMDRLAVVAAKAATLQPESFGLHMMLGSGFLNPEPFLLSLDLLLAQPLDVDFLNLGGGIGIPYRPHETAFDLPALARAIRERLDAAGRSPRILFECGRYILTPHGVLVTRVLNRMSKWRELVGVDSGMNALIRPAMYPHAYHHITVHGGDDRPTETVDVVGSLCENNDKFAIQRTLPRTQEGDLLLVHDTGAHALSMSFTYNGRLRPQELVLHPDGTVERIRRAETIADYFATLDCEADTLVAASPAIAAR